MTEPSFRLGQLQHSAHKGIPGKSGVAGGRRCGRALAGAGRAYGDIRGLGWGKSWFGPMAAAKALGVAVSAEVRVAPLLLSMESGLWQTFHCRSYLI